MMKDSARTFTAGCTQLIGDEEDNDDDNGDNDDDGDGDNGDARKSMMFTAGLQPGDRKLRVSNPSK